MPRTTKPGSVAKAPAKAVGTKATKTGMVRARIAADLKRDAEAILQRLGTSSSEAIRMLYAQVVLRGGLPFEVAVPNEATIRAIEELRRGGGTHVAGKEELHRDDLGL